MNDFIVSGEDCVACRYCCTFEEWELEELPIITDEKKRSLEEQFPALRFYRHGNCWTFHANKNEKEEFECPMLSEHGCILGDEKPFDCLIYPYCIMQQEKKLLITITPECRKACGKTREQIMSVLENGLADRIAEFVKVYPDLIRDYNAQYPVLMRLPML